MPKHIYCFHLNARVLLPHRFLAANLFCRWHSLLFCFVSAFAWYLRPPLVLLRAHFLDDSRTETWSTGWLPCCWITSKVRRSSMFACPRQTQHDTALMWKFISHRFMVKHLTDLLTTPTPQGAAADQPRSYEDAVFDKLKKKFPLIVFSCVQLASKLSLHSHVS